MSELDPTVMNAPAFPGERLRAAREQSGMSVEHVSRQLHLHAYVVEAIESGDLGRLNDPVFSRGYIRAYASFLKLDPVIFVTAYNEATGQKVTTGEVKAIGTVSMVPGRRQGHPVLKIGTWLFIGALIAACAWWWQAQHGFNDSANVSLLDQPVAIDTSDGNTLVLPPINEPESELVAPSPAPGEAITAVAVMPATTAAESEPEQTSATADAEAADAVPEAAESAGVEPVVDAPETSAELVAALDVLEQGLKIVLGDDCWLSVKAANGRSVYAGVAKAGTTLELEGEEPLAVTVGRVSAVREFSYAGRSIDLSARARDDVARLTLPL